MIVLLVLLGSAKVYCGMEGYVVHGDMAQIEYFAHSVFLSIREQHGVYICGSSILNQKVLLSAAHCFESCEASYVHAFAGNAQKLRGEKYQVSSYKIHEDYDEDEIKNDIGLAVLRSPLTLSSNIKRVSIVSSPPAKKVATVAGWGLVNEINGERSSWLHSSNQKLWTFSACRKILPGVPLGSLCAGDIKETSYASEGDSGSALIINGYIQVGLVSFKRPDTSRSLVVYTNVSYFYNWIKYTSKNLYCREKLGN